MEQALDRRALRGRPRRHRRPARAVGACRPLRGRAAGRRPRLHGRRRRAFARRLLARAHLEARRRHLRRAGYELTSSPSLALAVVFMLGVPTGATRTVDLVDGRLAGGRASGLEKGDEIVAVNGTRGRVHGSRRGDQRQRRQARHASRSSATARSCSWRARRSSIPRRTSTASASRSGSTTRATGRWRRSDARTRRDLGGDEGDRRLARAARDRRGPRRGLERRRDRPGLEPITRASASATTSRCSRSSASRWRC